MCQQCILGCIHKGTTSENMIINPLSTCLVWPHLKVLRTLKSVELCQLTPADSLPVVFGSCCLITRQLLTNWKNPVQSNKNYEGAGKADTYMYVYICVCVYKWLSELYMRYIQMLGRCHLFKFQTAVWLDCSYALWCIATKDAWGVAGCQHLQEQRCFWIIMGIHC